MVFHAFDIPVDGVFIDIKEFQKTGQCLMSVDDGTCDAQPFFRQDSASVFFMLNEPFGIEPLQHIGDAGLGNFQSFGNINRARVSLFFDEVKNLLEVVITGGRAAGAVGHRHGGRDRTVMPRIKIIA